MRVSIFASLACLLLASPALMAAPDAFTTPEQRAAVDRIETGLSFDGTNGFAALYSLGYNLTPAQQRQVLAEDAKRFAASSRSPRWTSSLNQVAPLPGDLNHNPAACRAKDLPGCLAYVRAHNKAVGVELSANKTRIDQAQALVAFDHFQSPFADRLDRPIASYYAIHWLPVRAAHQFASGDRAAGLATTCDAIRIGRSLLSGSDHLVGSMVGASAVARGSAVLAEMMAELPREEALPPSCDHALSPGLSPVNATCRALVSEGRFSMLGMRNEDMVGIVAAEQGVPRAVAAKLYNEDVSEAYEAPRFTQFCDAQSQKEIARDAPRSERAIKSMKGAVCTVAPYSCVLNNMQSPRYNNYALRIQDSIAIWETVRLLAKWREDGSGVALPAYWDKHHQGQRDVLVAQTHLSVPLYMHQPKRKSAQTLPLPGSAK